MVMCAGSSSGLPLLQLPDTRTLLPHPGGNFGSLRTTGTSRLNSHDGSSKNEKPGGDSVDLDWLTECATLLHREVSNMTEPTGPALRRQSKGCVEYLARTDLHQRITITPVCTSHYYC
ncbi:hypothetical protein Tco_1001285 [Tanacetum coccineum]